MNSCDVTSVMLEEFSIGDVATFVTFVVGIDHEHAFAQYHSTCHVRIAFILLSMMIENTAQLF